MNEYLRISEILYIEIRKLLNDLSKGIDFDDEEDQELFSKFMYLSRSYRNLIDNFDFFKKEFPN